jgi:hypothetical protein
MKFYRYENVNVYNLGVQVELRKYRLLKETPKGYWITYYSIGFSGDKRWVSKNGKNRFAYPTKEEAIFNFKMRKKRQISILENRLFDAKIALNKIEEIENANIRYNSR